MKIKKILLIVDDYMPKSQKVAAKMMHELASYYVRCGYEVSVLTPSCDIEKNYELLTLDGVTICFFKSGQIKNVSKIKRAINETLLPCIAWQNAKEYLLSNKHDYIVYYSPSIFFGFLVRKLKKLWGVQSYLILRDLFPQWAIDNGMIKKDSLIASYFRYFEKINYKYADRIGVMSEKNREWFVEHNKSFQNVEVLYNWVDIKKDKFVKDYKKILGIEDKIVCFYGGNLGYAQDMMNIMRVVKSMKDDKNVFFVIVGSGDEKELIADEIKKENLNNIKLLDAVSQDEYKQMLCSFDIGLFTLNKNHTTHNFPGKLLSYMVYDLAIVGSVNKGNDLVDLFQSYNAGLISINQDDEKFLSDLKAMLDVKKRDEISQNARKLLVDVFSLELASKQILKKVN